MKKKQHLLIFLISFIFLLSSTILNAQGVTTARITGFVFDTNGEPLPGANVIAVHEPSGTRYGASTRGNGVYRGCLKTQKI